MHGLEISCQKMGAPALSKLVLAQLDRIEHLELMVAKLQRQHFGPKSEKAAMNADQLMLSLSGTVIEAQEPPQASDDKTTRPPRKSRALPPHLPRQVRTHFPEHTKCPCCNGELGQAGRRCIGDAGVHAGQLLRDPSCASEDELQEVLHGGAGTGS